MLVAAGETIHLSTGDKRDYSSTKEVIDRPFSRGEVTGNLLEEGKASLKIQDIPETAEVDKMPNETGYETCTRLYWLQKLFAILSFGCLLTWILGYTEGPGLDRPEREFNFHPILMSLAFIFISGESITLYRGLRFIPKIKTKTAHAIINGIAFIIACFGLKAVYDSHNNAEPKPIPNFYSFHSWLGLALLTAHIGQFIAGFCSYVLPFTPMSIAEGSLPYHRMSGIFIFILSLANALQGFSELSAFSFKCWTENNELCTQMLFGNAFAALMVMYGVTVLTILLRHEWSRVPLYNEAFAPPEVRKQE